MNAIIRSQYFNCLAKINIVFCSHQMHYLHSALHDDVAEARQTPNDHSNLWRHDHKICIQQINIDPALRRAFDRSSDSEAPLELQWFR